MIMLMMVIMKRLMTIKLMPMIINYDDEHADARGYADTDVVAVDYYENDTANKDSCNKGDKL